MKFIIGWLFWGKTYRCMGSTDYCHKMFHGNDYHYYVFLYRSINGCYFVKEVEMMNYEINKWCKVRRFEYKGKTSFTSFTSFFNNSRHPNGSIYWYRAIPERRYLKYYVRMDLLRRISIYLCSDLINLILSFIYDEELKNHLTIQSEEHDVCASVTTIDEKYRPIPNQTYKIYDDTCP